ncbi:MAG: REP-associated tyrosine transposase [Luteimonas sp.]
MSPRIARLEIPGVPLHVTQRGVNRCAIFHDDQDRRCYRKLLWQACSRHHVKTHAFVLMGNHVHLLLAAAETGAISSAMRRVGQSYAQQFNLRHGRTGTLWQGRFKSCLVGDDRYLLTVMRYIELNPVRASMVADPAEYRWSSVHMHLGDCRDPWLVPHPLFLALGTDAKARGGVWARWLREGIATDDIAAIRRHLAQERALGDARFQREAEQRLGRPVAWRPAGRPALSRN